VAVSCASSSGRRTLPMSPTQHHDLIGMDSRRRRVRLAYSPSTSIRVGSAGHGAGDPLVPGARRSDRSPDGYSAGSAAGRRPRPGTGRRSPPGNRRRCSSRSYDTEARSPRLRRDFGRPVCPPRRAAPGLQALLDAAARAWGGRGRSRTKGWSGDGEPLAGWTVQGGRLRTTNVVATGRAGHAPALAEPRSARTVMGVCTTRRSDCLDNGDARSCSAVG